MGTSEMQLFVEAFFNALNIEFHIGIYYFTLLEVFYAGLLISCCGYFIGKVIFFFNNRR